MKQYALATILALASLPAFAAVNMSMDNLVNWVVYLIIIGFVFGILFFLVDKAPFIDPTWKAVIKYVIYFFAALFVINFLLGIAGHPIVNIR